MPAFWPIEADPRLVGTLRLRRSPVAAQSQKFFAGLAEWDNRSAFIQGALRAGWR